MAGFEVIPEAPRAGWKSGLPRGCAASSAAGAAISSIPSHEFHDPKDQHDESRKGIRRYGCGSATTQTTHSSAGVPAAVQLEGSTRRESAGVRGTVPLAPGNASLVLRQLPQEPLLLPWLWAGWRPDSLRPTLLASVVPTNPGAFAAATNSHF